MPKPKSKNTLNKTQREQDLGRMLVNIYETGYLDKNASYKNSFIKGVLAGFGGIVGATIVVGLLLWMLTLFKEVPLVGHLSESVKHTLQQRK